MSFYTDASLVLIPSGIKDQKVYCAKPVDGSADLTFSRGSDIEATRVNANGFIQKAQVNLLLQSNSFDTSWVNYNSTETGGQAGYDGTNDAWLLEKSAGFGRIYQSISATGVLTASLYAKAGTLSWIRFLMFDGVTDPQVYVNLTDGSLGSQYNNITATSTSVGGGWYRITLTFSKSITEFRIYPADGNNSVGGTSGNIYIQDAQLNYGLVAQTYQETTTAAVVSGITDDMPRLDYSGGASCPSLLLEPSRQNLIPHSEYIDDSGWSKTDATITTNAAISPEGVQNASLITFASGGFILESITTTKAIGDKETISVFSNADISGTFLKYGGGTAAGTDVEGREVIGNGWFRYYVTRTFTEAETASTQLIIAQSNVGNSVLIYGASLEKGYLSSYIPTYGSSATRTFDECEIVSASGLFGSSEGSMYAESKVIFDANGSMILTAGISSSNLIYIWTRTNGAVNFDFYQGGVVQASIVAPSGTITNGDSIKVALAYKNNDFVAYLNGSQVGTDTSGTAPNPTALKLGGYTAPDYYGSGIKQVLIFKTRLPNSDLATLTSL